MVILTCANADKAIQDGFVYKNFGFRRLIGDTISLSGRYGYKVDVYDLGNLGIGELYRVEDESFVAKGYYENEVKSGYKSKSLFKPEIVKLSMTKHDELIVYLDGDAQLCGCIDEVDTDDYDIGVTLRDAKELDNDWHRDHMDIVKYVNAGVIFFRPTQKTRDFVVSWANLTEQLGNDQMALNKLTCPDDYPAAWSVQVLNGVRVKYFPGKIYNFYYFMEAMALGAKIFHFKGSVRHFYPFDLKKRIFCFCAVPIINLASMMKKKFARFFPRKQTEPGISNLNK